jgi:integrase
MKITLAYYKGQPRYALSGYLSGKSVRKWFRSEALAQSFWDKKLKEMKRGAGAVLHLEDSDRATLAAAHELARKGGFTVLDAVQHYAAHLAARPEKSCTVTDAVALFLASRNAKGLRDRSVKSLENLLNAFCLKHGLRMVGDIVRDDIIAFMSPEWSAGTHNGYRTRLFTFFEWCVDAGYAKTNPVLKVERKQTDGYNPSVFSTDEVVRIIDACRQHDPELLPYFTLGLFAGIRPAELLRIEWSDIDINERIVTVGARKSKTKERRHVDLCDAALAYLALNKAMPTTNIRKRVEHIREVAGVTWGDDIMRHTFASMHVAHHRDAAKTAFQLGHRGDAQLLFTHYRNLVKPSDAERFWSLRPDVAANVVQLREVA